jgi:hypothetical protein
LAGLRTLILADFWAGASFHTRTRGQIGDRGARALAASPYLTGLNLLNLRGHPIGEEAAATLRQTFGPRVFLGP